jgi:hypothetical protein
MVGIDEVSRVATPGVSDGGYDLERRVVMWVGDGRTEDAVETYFTEELGTRRCRTLPGWSMFNEIRGLIGGSRDAAILLAYYRDP